MSQLRETVFNDACLDGTFATLDAASSAVKDICIGLADLINHSLAVKILRLPKPLHEIVLGAGINFHDVLLALLGDRSHREEGRFLASLALKVPVEDDISDSDFARLIEWELPDHPGSISLLLCTASGRIAVTASADESWYQAPLEVVTRMSLPAATGEESILVDHVFSAASAASIVENALEERRHALTPARLWAEREELFPNLAFGTGVEAQLTRLGARQFNAAVTRLGELNKAGGLWRKHETAVPPYLSKVTGESEATMDKYGGERVFRAPDGTNQTYELHARIADGFRIHLREQFASRTIEIGYVGPHLPTVKFN